MMVANNMLIDLKALLFDLTLSMDKDPEKDFVQELVNGVQRLTEADQVSICMNNKWRWSYHLDVYHSKADHHSVVSMAVEAMDYFEQSPPFRTISEGELTYHLIKLNCNDHYYGVMIAICSHQSKLDDKTLQICNDLIANYLNMEYVRRQQKRSHKRTQYFFELSTELHAIHETTEVLRNMYATFQKLYPFFDFTLLMSQDYACEDIPIELIEYSSDKTQTSGTMAFIDNKIKIDILHKQEVMHLYSPLAGKQGVYGVVRIKVPQIVDVSDLELELIEQYSNIAGMAIERTTLFQSSNKQIANLQMINSASHELNTNLKRSDIIAIVKKYILETSAADEFAVILFDETAEENAPVPYEVLDGSTPLFFSNQGRKLIHYLYETFHVDSDPVLSGNFQAKYKESPYHSLMAIPMWAKEAVFGFMVMAHPTPYYFTLDKFKFIQSFTQHASLAFQNSLLKEQLHKMATTDYLTKLYSRNYLDREVTEHMKSATSGIFALFDIDDFKQVNDTYGHYIGDQVLVSTAKVLQAIMINTDDIVARWGGEEFALYFPTITFKDAMAKVNEIRNSVYQETDPPVTLSCGVTEWRKGSAISSIEALFIRADEALYEAKASGKNKTVTKCLH